MKFAVFCMVALLAATAVSARSLSGHGEAGEAIKVHMPKHLKGESDGEAMHKMKKMHGEAVKAPKHLKGESDGEAMHKMKKMHGEAVKAPKHLKGESDGESGMGKHAKTIPAYKALAMENAGKLWDTAAVTPKPALDKVLLKAKYVKAPKGEDAEHHG